MAFESASFSTRPLKVASLEGSVAAVFVVTPWSAESASPLSLACPHNLGARADQAAEGQRQGNRPIAPASGRVGPRSPRHVCPRLWTLKILARRPTAASLPIISLVFRTGE